MARAVVPGLHLAALELDLSGPVDAFAPGGLGVADRAHPVLGLDREDLSVLHDKVIVAPRRPAVPAADLLPGAVDILEPDHIA
ncbi:hypothetical protein D3C72_1732700 [compost metagenome]